MSSFKNLNKADITTVSYAANKRWSFTYTFPVSGSYLNTYKGTKLTGSFNSGSDSVTNGQYDRLIYNSINHLFYQAYSGSLLNTSSLMFNTETYTSASQYRPTASYFDYNINPLLIKQFPTGAGEEIGLLSVNQEVYGSKILPHSFLLRSSSHTIVDEGHGNPYNSSGSVEILSSYIVHTIVDDGYGNLYNSSGSAGTLSSYIDSGYINDGYFISGVSSSVVLTHIGNIFYAHGLAVITNPSYLSLLTSGTSTVSFQNEHIIYENEIRCIIKESEFNLSYNPSLLDVSSSLYGFATSASFAPYATTIGLYNDENELLMVAKLGKPMLISPDTDMTFIVKYDI